MHSTVLQMSCIYITTCTDEDKECKIRCDLVDGVRSGFCEAQDTCIASLGPIAP